MKKDKIELKSQLDQITQIEILVDAVCSNNKVNEDCYGNILVALTEAVSNAIEHGNKFDDSKKITVTFESENKTIKFEITDEGQGFDFDNVPDPTAPENLEKINGRGVFLMRHLADNVTYLDNGKRVELTFNLYEN